MSYTKEMTKDQLRIFSKSGVETFSIDGEGKATLRVPKNYYLDVENIKTSEDVKEVFKLLNIRICEDYVNDKNKHLFKDFK